MPQAPEFGYTPVAEYNRGKQFRRDGTGFSRPGAGLARIGYTIHHSKLGAVSFEAQGPAKQAYRQRVRLSMPP